MATINAWKWERFTPDLGDNRTQAKPFYFLIRSGVSKLEMKSTLERIASAKDAEDPLKLILEALSEIVKMGEEPLTIGGKQVDSLASYFETVGEYLNAQPYLELVDAVQELNSYEGTKALFYARPSGGTASMRSPPTAKDTSPTGAQSSGIGTSH